MRCPPVANFAPASRCPHSASLCCCGPHRAASFLVISVCNLAHCHAANYNCPEMAGVHPGILHTGIAQHIHSMGSLTNKTFSSHWFIKQFSARYRCRFIPSLLALSLGLSPIKRFLFHWAPRPCPDWRHLNWQFKTNPAK